MSSVMDWLVKQLESKMPSELVQMAEELELSITTLKNIRERRHSPRLEVVEKIVQKIGYRVSVLRPTDDAFFGL